MQSYAESRTPLVILAQQYRSKTIESPMMNGC